MSNSVTCHCQVPVVQRAEGVPGAASVHLRGPLRQGYPLIPTKVCTIRSEATLLITTCALYLGILVGAVRRLYRELLVSERSVNICHYFSIKYFSNCVV